MTNDYHNYAFGGNCVECNIDVYVKGRVPQGSGAIKGRVPQCNIDVYVKGRVDLKNLQSLRRSAS